MSAVTLHPLRSQTVSIQFVISLKLYKMIGASGFANMYDTFDDFLKTVYRDKYGANAEIKALYWGNPKDNILIWKKGMNLPKASEQVENECKLYN